MVNMDVVDGVAEGPGDVSSTDLVLRCDNENHLADTHARCRDLLLQECETVGVCGKVGIDLVNDQGVDRLDLEVVIPHVTQPNDVPAAGAVCQLQSDGQFVSTYRPEDSQGGDLDHGVVTGQRAKTTAATAAAVPISARPGSMQRSGGQRSISMRTGGCSFMSSVS